MFCGALKPIVKGSILASIQSAAARLLGRAKYGSLRELFYRFIDTAFVESVFSVSVELNNTHLDVIIVHIHFFTR